MSNYVDDGCIQETFSKALGDRKPFSGFMVVYLEPYHHKVNMLRAQNCVGVGEN